MNPDARCGGSLSVAGLVESFGGEVVGEFASLGKGVDTFADFEVYLAIAGFVGEVVFAEEE